MPQIYKYHRRTHIPEKLRYALLQGWRGGLAAGPQPSPQGPPGQRGSRDEALRGAMADHLLGCSPPSRPTGQAAPTTEKPGVCHPGAGIPRHPNGPAVPPSATRGKFPSHVFPEMSTPKWLATGRWAGLCQSPRPHPFSGFLRRIQPSKTPQLINYLSISI